MKPLQKRSSLFAISARGSAFGPLRQREDPLSDHFAKPVEIHAAPSCGISYGRDEPAWGRSKTYELIASGDPQTCVGYPTRLRLLSRHTPHRAPSAGPSDTVGVGLDGPSRTATRAARGPAAPRIAAISSMWCACGGRLWKNLLVF
jgi:hypothetical protein